MPLNERQARMQEIEELREGRACIVLFNFDRRSFPDCDGLATQLDTSMKEPLYRVLKEAETLNGVDLVLYTRGGDVNAVWPLVSLIREFDEAFRVLVPYACHSAGTMMALGARQIVLGTISELSPIDPTCGNAFNPIDPVTGRNRLGISVEDVNAYREFILRQIGYDPAIINDPERSTIAKFLQNLVGTVHPLALGNVHRVFQQGRQLAEKLLEINGMKGADITTVVDELSSKFFSHLHMVNRHEAKRILGDRVEFAGPELNGAMDRLLREYEKDFQLRRPFIANEFLGQDHEKVARFIGGAVECRKWSYLHETMTRIRRVPHIPPNVQVHVKPSPKTSEYSRATQRLFGGIVGPHAERPTPWGAGESLGL